MIPVRIQLSRRAGFRLDEASRAVNGLPAKKVDRTTPYGNQFRVGKTATEVERARAVHLHREWLFSDAKPARYMRRQIRQFLAGHNVACWCGPGPCHADAILEVANGAQREKETTDG